MGIGPEKTKIQKFHKTCSADFFNFFYGGQHSKGSKIDEIFMFQDNYDYV